MVTTIRTIAANYLRSSEDRVQNTPNNRDGIEGVIEFLEDILASIDLDIQELLTARGAVGAYGTSFNGLYKAMTGEQLRPDEAFGFKLAMTAGDLGHRGARNRVLEIAIMLADMEQNKIVTDAAILDLLAAEQVHGSEGLPWANPKAVIGTILSRQTNFTKIGTGQYRYDPEELPW